MATNLTNSILTQIAIKRLSGKAMTSGKYSIPQEEYGSSVQVSAETVFGEIVPNTPISSSSTLYQIQSASIGGPGTVQQVVFDLNEIDGTSYANTLSGENDGEAEETVFGKDLGDPNATSTFHGYYVTLPSNYETLSTSHFANASTPKSLGDAPFQNGFASTGSTQFQIVPEYLSTEIGDGGEGQLGNNTYAVEILNNDGDRISPTSGIDYYFDSFAGILFIQDPSQVYTGTGATTPKKVRAFLYVGKYQSEAGGDSVSLHFSASQGSGFSFGNEATASFITGSTGEGLTIAASSGNTLEFTLNNVVSGSEQVIDLIEGDTTINITSSYAEEAIDLSIIEKHTGVAYHPLVFTNEGSAATPTNGGTSPERLSISNKSTDANDTGLYYLPPISGFTAIYLNSGSSAGTSNNGALILGNTKFEVKGEYSLLNTEATKINMGGGATTINIGGTSATTIVSGNLDVNLLDTETGAFTILNISESSERTPLVIDSSGKVTQADSTFATDIVISGSIGVSIVSASALSTGTGQGEYDLTVNGAVVSDNISSGLTTTDSPQFVGIEATNTAFNLATAQETTGNQTITIGNSSNGGNQIVLNGTASITGDLIVQGTTTTLNTANLLVEDKFILLNSGTLGSPADEGGIVVQTANDGTGTALFYDDDAGRWIITDKDQVAGSAANVSTDITKGTNTMAAVVTVQVDDNAPNHSPFFNTANFNQGQMYVDKSLTSVTDNNIWIYA